MCILISSSYPSIWHTNFVSVCIQKVSGKISGLTCEPILSLATYSSTEAYVIYSTLGW